MSKHRKTPPQKRTWTPLKRSKPLPNSQARAVDPDSYDLMIAEFESGKMVLYANSHVTVHLRTLEDAGMDGWVLLTIRHNDRRAIRDWRMFQQIKNELVGEEREAIELYPAESRLVDEANSYHLWVAPTNQPLPVGFNSGRIVGDADQAKAIGARQRRISMPTLPTSSEKE